MWISSSLERFKPENFVIVDFYGEETCFAWKNRNLVVFPFPNLESSTASTSSTPKLPVIVAPRAIKSIRSFNSRVYVICSPCGVYKFMQSFKFSVLSQSAIGMGSFYYEVVSVEDDWLFMKDKLTKSNRQLFKVERTTEDINNLCVIALSSSNSEDKLRRALHQLEENNEGDVCVIANEKKIFAITSKDVQLIYECEQEIVDIVPILKEERIFGFVLVAQNAAVLVYMNLEELVFDKIYLDVIVQSLCAGIDETSGDNIWIAHNDRECIYYSSKKIGKDSFRRIRTERKKFLVVRNYKNKYIVGLTDDKQLLEIEIQNAAPEIFDSEEKGEEFYRLRLEMLEGSDKLVDEICERAKELQFLNEIILEEQEKLRRINIYAHKQAIEYLPKVKVERIADEIFLRVQFEGVLPINCHVIVALSSGKETNYCIKLVEDSHVIIDVPLENEKLNYSLNLSIDLVTLTSESRTWCLIRNYVKAPKAQKKRISSERRKFITAKINALQNLTADGNLDMKKLSSIKKSIRKELPNFK